MEQLAPVGLADRRESDDPLGADAVQPRSSPIHRQLRQASAGRTARTGLAGFDIFGVAAPGISGFHYRPPGPSSSQAPAAGGLIDARAPFRADLVLRF